MVASHHFLFTVSYWIGVKKAPIDRQCFSLSSLQFAVSTGCLMGFMMGSASLHIQMCGCHFNRVRGLSMSIWSSEWLFPTFLDWLQSWCCLHSSVLQIFVRHPTNKLPYLCLYFIFTHLDLIWISAALATHVLMHLVAYSPSLQW